MFSPEFRHGGREHVEVVFMDMSSRLPVLIDADLILPKTNHAGQITIAAEMSIKWCDLKSGRTGHFPSIQVSQPVLDAWKHAFLDGPSETYLDIIATKTRDFRRQNLDL